MAVVGFEQTTYTFREDAGMVDLCTTFLQPAEIDQNVFVDLLGSTTNGSADGEKISSNTQARRSGRHPI